MLLDPASYTTILLKNIFYWLTTSGFTIAGSAKVRDVGKDNVPKKTLLLVLMHTHSSWKTQRNAYNPALKIKAIDVVVKDRDTACKLDFNESMVTHWR